MSDQKTRTLLKNLTIDEKLRLLGILEGLNAMNMTEEEFSKLAAYAQRLISSHKTANVSFQINVSEDFHPGECKKCPLCLVKGYENAMRVWEESTVCKIGFSPATCPVRPVEAATPQYAAAAARAIRKHESRHRPLSEIPCPKCGENALRIMRYDGYLPDFPEYVVGCDECGWECPDGKSTDIGDAEVMFRLNIRREQG